MTNYTNDFFDSIDNNVADHMKNFSELVKRATSTGYASYELKEDGSIIMISFNNKQYKLDWYRSIERMLENYDPECNYTSDTEEELKHYFYDIVETCVQCKAIIDEERK